MSKAKLKLTVKQKSQLELDREAAKKAVLKSAMKWFKTFNCPVVYDDPDDDFYWKRPDESKAYIQLIVDCAHARMLGVK